MKKDGGAGVEPSEVCEDEGEENPKTTKLTMKISGDTSSKKRGTSSDWNYGEIRKAFISSHRARGFLCSSPKSMG